MFKKTIVFIILITFTLLAYKKIFGKCESFSDNNCNHNENEKYNIENEKKLYDKLLGLQPGDNKSNWDKIFEHANRNRNAAGPMFYNWIVNEMNPTKEEFESYNKFYCGVSGSVVQPGSKPSFVRIKETGTENFTCGYYYKCCWPCVCDIMKYAQTEEIEIKLKNGKFKYYVLTIEDPCKNELNIPNDVSAFICKDNKTINGKFAPSGRLIFALLHKGKICSNEDINNVNTCLLNSVCSKRNNTKPNNLVGGMGDIFVKLSLGIK